MLKDMFQNKKQICTASKYIFYSAAVLKTGKAFQNIVVYLSSKDDKTKTSEFPADFLEAMD